MSNNHSQAINAGAGAAVAAAVLQTAIALQRALAAAIAAGQRYFERRRTERYLQGLSDHLLRDIGVQRRDIARIVSGR